MLKQKNEFSECCLMSSRLKRDLRPKKNAPPSTATGAPLNWLEHLPTIPSIKSYNSSLPFFILFYFILFHTGIPVPNRNKCHGRYKFDASTNELSPRGSGNPVQLLRQRVVRFDSSQASISFSFLSKSTENKNVLPWKNTFNLLLLISHFLFIFGNSQTIGNRANNRSWSCSISGCTAKQHYNIYV
jgi:hypothetical protein